MPGRILRPIRWCVALSMIAVTLFSQQSTLRAEQLADTSTPHSYSIPPAPEITAAQGITPTRKAGITMPSAATTNSETSVTSNDQAVAATQTTEDEPISSLSDVEAAVVQIEAIGTFVDPAEGLQLNAAGRGSGFIIDPSGIAVTNNHVVTGGGLYKVYVAGETEPRNAKVLGVSECADLAVIDIQGDGFPYLSWYEERIRVGLDVYAAGFPLGEPEYTLTRGIVSKERANGKTSWASVSKVIQHDATINPGNSGGPLVDANGQVVAVNYAGNSETNQYFAISRDDALDLIERLWAGENVDTIGINGEAVSNGDDFSGIWVSSVKSGSPADRVGILPGDILVAMEGISLATDGTMATYCDILRSHEPNDVLAIEVLRFDTQELLEGQLNGRELAISFSFADELTEENAGTGNQSSTTGAPTSYSSYTTASDRNGILSMEVPVEWEDISEDDWIWREEPVGLRLVATTDIDSVFNSWDTPGVLFNVSTSLVEENTPADLLDAVDYSEVCTHDGREEIIDGYYTGSYDIWTECDNSDSRAVVVSVVPETNDFIVLFEIYITNEADIEALDQILDSFVVNLESSSTTGQSDTSDDIFDLVDVSGLTYDYLLVSEPALSGILPADWAEVVSDDWVNSEDEIIGKTLSVSPDIQAFNDTWSMAGLYVRSATGLEEALDIDELLDSVDLSDTCAYDDRYDHSHTIYGVTYTGAYDIYTNCDDEENAFAYLVAQSDDLSQAVFIEFLVTTDADAEAFDVLLQSFYIAPSAGEEGGEGSESTTTAYTLLTDETETLTVRVPTEWSDVSSGDWILDNETIGISLKAAIDLEDYDSSWSAPGIFFGASQEFAGVDSEDVLDNMDYSDNCDSSERFEYDDTVFIGHYDLWEGCGGTESLWVVLAAQPKESADYLVLINVLLPVADDISALEEVFKSFNVAFGDSDDGGDNALPIAQVTTNALNIRSGPGTNYNRIGSASQGDQLVVIGQVDNCGWLNVQTRDDILGWVSGSTRYVTLDTDCTAIPVAEAPAPPQNSGSTQRPSPVAPASTKGCYLFQNQIGTELTITFTRKGDGWNTTFKVAANTEVQQCFDPGDYTYTLDAPPPWDSTNGEMSISAGDNYTFPISPE
ncbi:MAG: trypsin-like peptidase domain-containing protein [Caldilineaceae bacterium]|nr:trypsin-like peptidase domain-containing protein [Caldilineaceae bacterium]